MNKYELRCLLFACDDGDFRNLQIAHMQPLLHSYDSCFRFENSWGGNGTCLVALIAHQRERGHQVLRRLDASEELRLLACRALLYALKNKEEKTQ